MSVTPHIESLRVARPSLGGIRHRLFREWCFVRALARRLLYRIIALVGIVMFGGWVFYGSDLRGNEGYVDSVYLAFGLIFGDHPPQLPASWILRVMYFLLPVLGLGVVLEGIVEIAAIVRDRRLNERSWSIVMVESLSNHVVLVGLGRVGFRIYRTLHRLGVPVVIVDFNENAEFLAEARLDGSPILLGDARREALLDEAGITRARAVVVATNNDLVNLEVALDARTKHPNIRVVMRMFDQNMADKVHAGFDIPAVLSTAAIAAPTFAAAAIVENVIATTLVANQLLVTIKTCVKERDAWCDRTLQEITAEHRLHVLGHAHSGDAMTVLPSLSTRLLPGDELVVQGLYDELLGLALSRS
ncbi:MAG: NAD-binding protein [Polyangiaceae bacterium]